MTPRPVPGAPMTETAAVYLLSGLTGQGSDRMEWVVRAYTNKAAADADCAAMNTLASQGNPRDLRSRDELAERLRQHDANAEVDYTGTDYFVAEVPLVSVAQITAPPADP